MGDTILEVRDLKTHFKTEEGVVRAVDGVSFAIERGGIMALVGESGSGKSITGLSILRLVPRPGRIVGGQVLFKGEDLLTRSEHQMRHYRGNRISMIFQNPNTSLDPCFTVGEQIVETIRLHTPQSKAEAVKQAAEMLRLVGVPDPMGTLNRYPHSMSGGMRQRIMIAMALACKPDLLIADEPTTALDVSVQAQILDLLERLNRELGTAILMITHDMGVVARLCKTVAVMYAGRIVEYAAKDVTLNQPRHPYTMGLMNSVPRVGSHSRRLRTDGTLSTRQRLFQIDGTPPNLTSLPPGCAFAPRCREAIDACRQDVPPVIQVGSGHQVRCILRAEAGEQHAG